MATTIERINPAKNKPELTKMISEAKKNLKDSFSKSSQSELLDLLEQGGNAHTMHLTGDIINIKGDISGSKVFDVFLTTTEGTKLKLSKQHLDNLETVAKDKEVRVILKFNEVKESTPEQQDGESKENYAARVARNENLLKYRVEYKGMKGYVVFDSIQW